MGVDELTKKMMALAPESVMICTNLVGMDEMKMFYVAIDIGCIECGENSALLGVFSSEDKAQKVCDEAEASQERNWHGQHNFGVFEWNGKIDTAIIPSYGK